MKHHLVTAICSFLWITQSLGNPHTTTEQQTTCKFQPYLTKRPKWETKIQNERRSTGMFVRFTETTMSVTDFSKVSSEETVHDVIQCFDGGKYLLKLRDEEKYICLGITQSSSYVLQWRMSDIMGAASSSLCEDEQLVDEKWPLIWPILEKGNYETCPMPGGYNLQIFDNENKQHCKNYWMPPRLENECMTGEGMQINFRHFDCKGTLGMRLKQSLFCLGTWIAGDFQYSVVSNGDDLWPKLWLARVGVSTLDQDEFDMKVFKDIVGESEEIPVQTNRYYTWRLAKGGEEPICANEAAEDKCVIDETSTQQCDSLKQTYCMKSCDACDSNVLQENCEFPEALKGQWKSSNVHKEHNFELSISDAVSMSSGNGLATFQCVNRSKGIEWYKNANRYPVVATFDNGCKPRYACLEAKDNGPNVLSYRLSQSIIWPIYISHEALCWNDRYHDDAGPLRNIIRSQNRQMLVKAGSDADSGGNDVECAPRTETVLNPIDKKYGWSSIKSNGPDKSVIVNHTCLSELDPNFSNMTFHTNEWKCLSSFEQGNSKFAIVESESLDVSPKVQCWVTHQNEWSPLVYLYAVYPSDCNEAISRHIQFDGYDGHLAAYTLDTTVTSSDMPCIIDEDLVVTQSTSSPMPPSTASRYSYPDSTTEQSISKATSRSDSTVDDVSSLSSHQTELVTQRTDTTTTTTNIPEIKSTTRKLVTQHIPPSENTTNSHLYNLDPDNQGKIYSSKASMEIHCGSFVRLLTTAIITVLLTRYG